MNVAEILHAILNIAAGDGAQSWLHDEIDKLEGAAKKDVAAAEVKVDGFLAAPGAAS
jgi:hypothetical protein